MTHTTVYTFDRPVAACGVRALLRPRDGGGQRLAFAQVLTVPPPARRTAHRDRFGNAVDRLRVEGRFRRLQVTGTSLVRLAAGDPPPPEPPHPALAAAPPASPALASWVARLLPQAAPDRAAVAAFAERLGDALTYDPAATDLATPLETVLERRRGVCLDFARLAVACLRARGVAARLVTGYALPAGGGAAAFHAWFGAWFPGCGWVDFDPTLRRDPAGRTVTLAWGAGYAAIQPVAGIVAGPARPRLSVAITLTPEPAS
ncbi:transglutaminase family protein [Azospirillum sp. ST 5-10]|uniref:transglutaminase family protein n=1 Tax=Azospirillum sp. ST 5-10 TaxID=3445776 RepID=UPI003F49FF52